MKNGYRLCALIVLCIFTAVSCKTIPKEAATSTTISPVPEPYTKDEFPAWARDLRRAEIVTLGSIPFTVLFSTLGYTTYRYIDYGFDSAYSPNPFAKSSESANLNASEQIGIIAAAAGISLTLGIVDFVISYIKRKSAAKKELRKSIDGSVITIEKNTPLSELPPVAAPLIESSGEKDRAAY